MDFVEVIRQAHGYSHNQNEEYYKFLEGHEGSQRHDSNAVTRKYVDCAHDERVRYDVDQLLQLHEGLPAHALVDSNDHYPLNEKHLHRRESTVE